MSRSGFADRGANAAATLGGGGVLGREIQNKSIRRCRAVACPGHVGSAASVGLGAAAGRLEVWRQATVWDSSGMRDGCVVMQNIHLRREVPCMLVSNKQILLAHHKVTVIHI